MGPSNAGGDPGKSMRNTGETSLNITGRSHCCLLKGNVPTESARAQMSSTRWTPLKSPQQPNSGRLLRGCIVVHHMILQALGGKNVYPQDLAASDVLSTTRPSHDVFPYLPCNCFPGETGLIQTARPPVVQPVHLA